jgi:hypothetical protein
MYYVDAMPTVASFSPQLAETFFSYISNFSILG